MGYRVVHVTLEAAQLTLESGVLVAEPRDVPPDLKIVDARVDPRLRTLDLMVFSATFPPDDTDRAIMLGGAHHQDWARLQPFVLEGTHERRRVTPCLEGSR